MFLAPFFVSYFIHRLDLMKKKRNFNTQVNDLIKKIKTEFSSSHFQIIHSFGKKENIIFHDKEMRKI